MSPRPRPRSTALALALALVTGGVSRADDAAPVRRPTVTRRQAARAAKLRQRGLEHFVDRDYQLAADELMEAYRLDKREATLFGWAEAVRATGDCELATRIYKLLLDKTATPKLAEGAELGVAACEAQRQAEPPISGLRASNASVIPALGPAPAELVPEPAAPTTGADPAAEPSPAADEVQLADAGPAAGAPPTRPVHMTSYLLIGGGAFATLAGLATYATASTATDPNASHAAVTAARSDADWHRLIGASLGVAGASIVLVGVLRYRSESRTARTPAVVITPYVGAAGAGVALGGSF